MDENQSGNNPIEAAPDIPQDIKDALFSLLGYIEREDEGIREIMLAKWRRLDLYFNNILNIWLDAGSMTWRSPDWDQFRGDLEEDFGEDAPRIMAVYRSYAESVIAALSVRTPDIIFYPDDADNADDIETATSASVVTQIIERHNRAKMAFMRGIAILFNQGTVLGYNSYRRDKKFGYFTSKRTEDQQVEGFNQICPTCGELLGSTPTPEPTPTFCSYCGQDQMPQVEPGLPIHQEVEIEEKKEKGRVFVDISGPLDVKIPFYAKTASHCGYLLKKFDQSVGLLRSVYTEIADKIEASQGSGEYNWTRYAVQYLGSAPQNTAVVKALWLRPFQYYALGHTQSDKIQMLLTNYPNGCYCVFINDILVEANDEDMDEHWTISESPLSNYIHGEPPGTVLATVQDITAEVDQLQLETMEHGIPENFVDEDAIDIEAYGKGRSKPGMVTPLKRAAGEALGSAFHSFKPAIFSQEIAIYQKSLQERAQFTSAAFPSIYGGPSEGGGGTASEYTQSKNQALQRLTIIWQVVADFWCRLMHKSVFEYISNLKAEQRDEMVVMREGSSFKNLFVRLSSLNGTIGHVEPDYSEELPRSWMEHKTTISELLMMKSPQIDSVLFHPQNNEIMKKAVGMPELYIPGEDQRNAQYREILELSQSQPIQAGMDPQMGQSPFAQMFGGLEPSVMPTDIDDDPVHSMICKVWMTSAAGMDAKKNNPMGYQNVYLHFQIHEMKAQMKMAQEQPPGGETAEPNQGESSAPPVTS